MYDRHIFAAITAITTFVIAWIGYFADVWTRARRHMFETIASDAFVKKTIVDNSGARVVYNYTGCIQSCICYAMGWVAPCIATADAGCDFVLLDVYNKRTDTIFTMMTTGDSSRHNSNLLCEKFGGTRNDIIILNNHNVTALFHSLYVRDLTVDQVIAALKATGRLPRSKCSGGDIDSYPHNRLWIFSPLDSTDRWLYGTDIATI